VPARHAADAALALDTSGRTRSAPSSADPVPPSLASRSAPVVALLFSTYSSSGRDSGLTVPISGETTCASCGVYGLGARDLWVDRRSDSIRLAIDGDPLQSRDARELMAVAALVVVVVACSVVAAQTPVRTQEVTILRIEVSLKDGWQLVFYKGCRFAVPSSWHAEADGSLARAPDGSNVSIRMFQMRSWSAHKAQIRAAFGHVNAVHEDSERRLWFEIGGETRVQHYIGVPNGVSVCAALLEIHPGTTPDTQNTTTQIVESIGPVPMPAVRRPGAIR
jgi:hypothetical protein